MKKRVLAIILVISLFFTVSSFAAKESDNPANYKTLGNILKDLKLIYGSGDPSNLKENDLLTREEAVVIILRLLKKEKIAESADPQGKGIFVDVPRGHWAIRYLEFAYENGITSGVGEKQFGLGKHITKKEFITLLLRELGYKTDWAKNDALEVGKKCGILDEVDGLNDKIVRGQVFTYMVNALFVKPNNDNRTLYKKLGLSSDSSYFAELNKEQPSDGKTTQKKPVVVDFNEYPKMVRARTYMYDEFIIEFNKLVQADKSNFKFRVEDRDIPESKWSVAPIGTEARFRFKEQNLHGKELICTVTGVVDNMGRPMLGIGKISATFMDSPPVYFQKTVVTGNKQFECFLSEKYQPPQQGQDYGYEVTLNGEVLQDKKDYNMGWGGNSFKVVFKEPKYGKAALKVWGWVSLHTRKYMDPIFVEVDLEDKEEKTYDAPPVGTTKEAEISYEIDQNAVDIIESHFHESNTGTSSDYTTAESTIESTTVTVTGSEYSATATTEPSSDGCKPAMVYMSHTADLEVTFYTTKPIRSIDGIVLEMSDGSKYNVEASIPSSFSGFTIKVPANAIRYIDGAKLHVEIMVEEECGAITDPFIYVLDRTVN
ncbi:MAG: S-layer homology domain-containing protein [Bacillota bacterium]|nr:S-layer homology domain-containing protein [Bacillota bacterium]